MFQAHGHANQALANTGRLALASVMRPCEVLAG
jgi:hypothetical protein